MGLRVPNRISTGGLQAVIGAVHDHDEHDHAADAELVRRLAQAGFSGALQAALESVLVNYALPVLCAWQHDGSIFGRCQAEGRGIKPASGDRDVLRDDPTERLELAVETVAQALVVFRRCGLRDGGWRPEAGRSLRSYFVAACVREYSGVFRRWSGERKRQPRAAGYGVVPPEHSGFDRTTATMPDPSDVISDRLDSRSVDMPDGIRRIAELRDAGHSYAEIAEELGISERAVEGRLSRYRKNYRRKT